ncbi:thiamine phosphate synthase [Hypericibacter sp.]|uniref:thiamine phosphate synthase n=1 Tax=Hypericibacter sp. TaxID=2705401 RepID=UPI003D6D1C43
MKATLPSPPLMVITNRHMTADLLATVEDALHGGARWILMREKDMKQPAKLELARQLKALTDRHSAHLGVNSDRTTALSIGAAGLHLPADQLDRGEREPGLLMGASVHDAKEAEAAVVAGVDYLLLAPIFATESKPMHRPPLGLDGLRAIAEAVPLPVIALGGINPERASACLEAGAAGIAAMGAVMRAADAGAVVRAFLKAMSP